MHACASALGLPQPAVEAALGNDPAVLLAADKLLAAAAETAWIQKLAVLGQLLADAANLGSDGNAGRLIVESRAVTALEEPHLALLATVAQRRVPEPPSDRTAWSYDHLMQHLPYESGVLDALIATLIANGLIEDTVTELYPGEREAFWTASIFGRHLLVVFEQAAETLSQARDTSG